MLFLLGKSRTTSEGTVLSKSSSTPSLADSIEVQNKNSVASTDQATSADNLAAKVGLAIFYACYVLSSIFLNKHLMNL